MPLTPRMPLTLNHRSVDRCHLWFMGYSHARSCWVRSDGDADETPCEPAGPVLLVAMMSAICAGPAAATTAGSLLFKFTFDSQAGNTCCSQTYLLSVSRVSRRRWRWEQSKWDQ
jgi:hypothetical protein